MGTFRKLLVPVACWALSFFCVVGPARFGPALAGPVDLELVLAVDASSSVDMKEFNLQMRGLAEAFRHPAVINAIRSVGDRGIVVCLVQWADTHKYRVAIDWMAVFDQASADKLAQEMMLVPRFIAGGGTDIRGAMRYALRQFDENLFEGLRKVIDISGDGRANVGEHPKDLRNRAVAQGVTVNGLVIVDEDPLVHSYYRDNVIGGTGAFLMTADSYEDFAAAIVKKLVREIAGTPLATRALPPAY